jgi:hypothetical protein
MIFMHRLSLFCVYEIQLILYKVFNVVIVWTQIQDTLKQSFLNNKTGNNDFIFSTLIGKESQSCCVENKINKSYCNGCFLIQITYFYDTLNDII